MSNCDIFAAPGLCTPVGNMTQGKQSGWSSESRHARGYGSEWDRIRKVILARDHYICQCPDCKGGELRVRVANQVDHILPKANGGTDDPSNLRAVNFECHAKLTLEQRGYKPKPSIGLDGWPIANDRST